MRTTPWLWLPLLLACAPCFAQGQPAIAAQCTQCRDNAATQQRKCEAAARAPAQREVCGTSGAQAQNACAEGACKGLATASMTDCAICIRKAQVEVGRCEQKARSPADHTACRSVGDERRRVCDERACRAGASAKAP